jgi:hypothetical protein
MSSGNLKKNNFLWRGIIFDHFSQNSRFFTIRLFCVMRNIVFYGKMVIFNKMIKWEIFLKTLKRYEK